LQRQNAQLHNPEACGFTESDFRNRLDNVIEKLQNISKHSFRLESADVKIVKITLDDMLMMRDDLNTKSAARQNRRAPFGLLIFGDSGIGKTTITSMLCTFFAKHEGLPSGPEFRYTVNPAAKYWDGFFNIPTYCHFR
jgi:SpoVK/Ycf46/Vps4 family AAA+-type ATPase